MLVVDGGSGAREVVDLVDFDDKFFDNIMADEFEIGVPDPLGDVFLLTGKERVGDDYLVSTLHEVVDKVRADEPGAAGNKNAGTMPRFGLALVKKGDGGGGHFWSGDLLEKD